MRKYSGFMSDDGQFTAAFSREVLEYETNKKHRSMFGNFMNEYTIEIGDDLMEFLNDKKSEVLGFYNIQEQLEAENAELKENWAELLLFAQEHDAGKFLYVEASEFIDKMEELRGGE